MGPCDATGGGTRCLVCFPDRRRSVRKLQLACVSPAVVSTFYRIINGGGSRVGRESDELLLVIGAH